MTDRYYAKEDDIQETPETALANYQAAQNQVANFVHEAAADMNSAQAILKLFWDRAVAEGDAAAQDNINGIWALFEKTSTRLGQLDANGQLANTALQKIEERRRTIEDERRRIQEERAQLEDAIHYAASYGYSTHPLIVDMVNALNKELLDSVEEQVGLEGGLFIEENVEQVVFENGWWDCIQEGAIEDLVNVLFRSDWAQKVPTELRESLSQAINEFSDAFTEHIESQRMQVEQMLIDEEAEEFDE